MDSLTHIALGACMGEAFAGKKLGKKAMVWGALAQSLPDIDFLSALWMKTPSALLAHRGFTHSFLFCLFITPFLALIAEKWHRPHDISLRKWLLFFGGVIFIHVFIDAFNNYGVGWFEPFSHERISFDAIYVADPFFSIWPGIALMALVFIRRRKPQRKRWWMMGLGISTLYLLYCLLNKSMIDHRVKNTLHKDGIAYSKYLSTPAPLQNWLWFIVAGNDSGFYVGYKSVFDKKEKLDLTFFPQDKYLLEPVKGSEDLHKLIRFSNGFYTAQQWHDTLVFNDLRFGQVIGWKQPREAFAFHYYLNYPEENKLVVQRGRFAKWDKDVIFSLINRIRGE